MGKLKSAIRNTTGAANKDFSRMSREIKRASLAITGALTAVTVLTVKAAIDFESSFAGVRKTVNATESEFNTLEKGLKRLSKQIPVNVNELNKIAESAGQLGIETDNILGFTKVMADLGVATNLTGDEAATMLARFDNVTTGGAQATFEQLGATIVALGNNLATTEREILEMAQRLAGSGAQIGLTQADILSLSGALSSVGLAAEAGGTAFSRVMVEMQNAVLDGGASLKIFNEVIQGDFKKAFEKDAAEAITAFVAGLARMSESGQNINPVLEDLGLGAIRVSDSLKRTGNAVEKIAGSLKLGRQAWIDMNALNEEAAKKYATTASQIDMLKNRIGLIGISIGDQLLPHVNDLVSKLSDWFDKNEDLINQNVAILIDGIKTAAQNLKTVLGLLPSSIQDVQKDFHSLGVTILAVNETIALVLKGIGLITKARAFLNENSFLESDRERGKALRAQSESIDKMIADIDNANQKFAQDITTNPVVKASERATEAVKQISQELTDELFPPLIKINDTTLVLNENWGAFGEMGPRNIEKTVRASQDLNASIEEAEEKQEDLTKKTNEGTKATNKNTDENEKNTKSKKKRTTAERELEKAQSEQIQRDKDAIESVRQLAKQWEEQADKLGLTVQELRQYELDSLKVDLATQDLSDTIRTELNVELENTKKALSNLNIKELEKQMFEFAGSIKDSIFGSLTDGSNKAKEELDSLGTFAGNIATNIAESFSDVIFDGLTNQFDGIGDLWDGLLDSMKRSLADFAAAILTNPIRISLEASLKGNSAGGGGGLFSGIGDLLSPVGDLFKDGGPLGAIGDLFKEGGIFGSIGGLFAEGGPLGFIGSIGSFLGPIGAAVSAIASIAIPLISAIGDIFKKKPRLDIDFDTFRDNVGKSTGEAAKVMDFLNNEAFDEIFNLSVSRKAGLGVGGAEGIKELIQAAISAQIEVIQDIINKLPSDLAKTLNESLLNTAVDIETKVKGDRLLEFDESKKIAEKFQQFIEGDLQARFVASIGSFFEGAFESLGVMSEGAQGMVDDFLENIKGADREGRIELGEEFLLNFNAFVDAFNFASGRFGDTAMEAVDSLKNLSNELGFEGIPNIQQMQDAMSEMIQSADIDPQTVEKMKALKQGIEDLGLSLAATNLSLIQFIDSLSSTIVQLDGLDHDTSGILDDTINSLMNLVQGGSLGFQGTFSALQQLEQAVGLQIQKELQAAQAAIDGQNASIQQQNSAIQEQINSTEEQIRLVQEKGREEIDALEEALSVLEKFKSLAENLKNDLRSLFTGNNSILSPFEKLNFIQGEVAAAAQKLAQATTAEGKLAGLQDLRALQGDLISLGSGAFGSASPEFQAIFRQVADELQALANTAKEEGAKVETVQDKLDAVRESIESEVQRLQQSIESSQSQIQELGSQQVKLSGETAERLREILEFAREEAKKLLEQSNEALKELGVDTSLLNPIEAINAEMLTVLRDIRDSFGNIIPAASGFRGMVSSPQLFLAGEAGPEFVNISPFNNFSGGFESGSSRSVEINANIKLTGDSSDSTKRFFAKEMAREMKKFMTEGEGRDIIKSNIRSHR